MTAPIYRKDAIKQLFPEAISLTDGHSRLQCNEFLPKSTQSRSQLVNVISIHYKSTALLII
jgi:hypothetical protein